jgi:hypothetical protein
VARAAGSFDAGRDRRVIRGDTYHFEIVANEPGARRIEVA